MKNNEIYVKEPGKNQLLNNGVATVTDEQTEEELRTLRYELETFVCEGEYENGMRRILEAYINNLSAPEQPGVWVSGFFGSGKSHFVKMLRALWADFVFPDDRASARGLVTLPDTVSDLLKEISTAGRRGGGLHAASGTLGAGAGENVRLALLSIVFKSAGLPEEYPLAEFVMWLKDQGYYDSVRAAVEKAGKDWASELKHLYVSPLIANALLEVYPDMAESAKKVRELLKANYPNVADVSTTQMVNAINSALSIDGRFPLTLIALDEVQQYIGGISDRAYAIQEMTEACCKKFAGKLLFVATGQTALSGTEMLQKLMGRFPVPIELSDADVEAVIRKVILKKKPDCFSDIEKIVTEYSGEISRHLSGTLIEYRTEDRDWLVPDYPILPVRRRFWERILRAVDQAGTAAQLRNQLKVVHEAARVTADWELGVVVGGDFIFNQIETNLLQTGVLPKEIYEYIKNLRTGTEDDKLKARLCGLVFLIGKLPREAGSDTGIRAKPDMLADLLVEDLKTGSTDLRKKIPVLLADLEKDGKAMVVGDEYRLQTRESSAWNDEFRKHLSIVSSNAQILETARSDLFRKKCGEHLNNIRLTHGKCKESRSPLPHFGADEPKDASKNLYVWIRDGWEEDEKTVMADARAAGNQSPMLFMYIPRRSADDLKKALADLYASDNTLEVRGVTDTPEGKEAQAAMETRKTNAENRVKTLVKDIFEGVRIFQAGGQEIIESSLNESLTDGLKKALVRLYPQFDVADHPKWSRVMEQARKGDNGALEAVGYKGDPEKHSACAAIIKFIGSGKKGSDIRKAFEDPGYGWSRDAIDGCIYLLLLTGHIRATDAYNKPVDAKSLERSKLTQTDFRVESTTITITQRLGIRKLLQNIKIPCKPNEESAAISLMIAEMKKRAEHAGGDAPRLERPSIIYIEDMEGLAGNDQLIEVFDNRDKIDADAENWIDFADEIEKRMPRWTTLQSLLKHADGISAIADVKKQADAIYNKRLLLSNPDPLPDLCDEATKLLRDALVKAQADYRSAYDSEMNNLKENENWRKLNQDQQKEILSKQDISGIPEIETGTEKEILQSLSSISLSTWKDRSDALAGRFRKARHAAAELLEPEIQYVSLPSRTLYNETDVREWLDDVEMLLIDYVKNGPVEMQ